MVSLVLKHNLGMFGIDTFNAIINPPECSILGVGRTVEKPVVEEGEVQIKPNCMADVIFGSSDRRRGYCSAVSPAG